MATIPHPGFGWRHVRKTLTGLDGSPGKGASGDNLLLFSVQGTVLVDPNLIVVQVENFEIAGDFDESYANIYILPRAGAALEDAEDDYFLDLTLFSGIGRSGVGFLEQKSVIPRAVAGSHTHDSDSSLKPFFTNQNIYFQIYPNEDFKEGDPVITADKITVDMWYLPVSDDAALVGDDHDESPAEHIWNHSLVELTGVPAATAKVRDAIAWLFTLARNRRTQTTTTETVYADDGSTPIATSAKSDDGSTFTRGEYQ